MKSVLLFVFLFVAIGFVVTTSPVAYASPVAEENKDEAASTTPEEEEQPQQQEPEQEAQPEETTEEPVATEAETDPNLVQEEDTTVGPDNDCLFNPSLPKCASNEGVCPDGFNQNEDGNCYPEHPNGCPTGYHSHEDDETGQCIPDDVPCEPGYTRDPDFPTCSSIDSVCRDHPNENVCNNGGNDNDNDDDNGKDNDGRDKQRHDKVIKIIKNIDIVNKINNADNNDNDDLDIEQTIVAINYQEGAGINCVFDEQDNGQCETFDVTKDSNKDPLFQIIPFS